MGASIRALFQTLAAAIRRSIIAIVLIAVLVILWLLGWIFFLNIDNMLFKLLGTFIFVLPLMLAIFFMIAFSKADREQVRHHTGDAVQNAGGDAPRDLLFTREGLTALFGAMMVVCAYKSLGGHDMDAVLFDPSLSATPIAASEVAWTWALVTCLGLLAIFGISTVAKHMPKSSNGHGGH